MDCNTKEGIAARLGTYTELYELIRQRYKLGCYKPDGQYGKDYAQLTPFVLLGRFMSDEMGGCHTLLRDIFTDADRAFMPPVMTKEEFDAFFKERVLPRLRKAIRFIEAKLDE